MIFEVVKGLFNLAVATDMDKPIADAIGNTKAAKAAAPYVDKGANTVAKHLPWNQKWRTTNEARGCVWDCTADLGSPACGPNCNSPRVRKGRPAQPSAPNTPPATPPRPAQPTSNRPAATPQRPAGTTTARPGGYDVVAAMKKLVELRDLGLITDREFEAKKADLLNKM